VIDHCSAVLVVLLELSELSPLHLAQHSSNAQRFLLIVCAHTFPVCTDTAAYLLQKSLEVEATDPLPLIEALYWLESAYVLETMNISTAQQMRALRASPANVHDNSTHGNRFGALTTLWNNIVSAVAPTTALNSTSVSVTGDSSVAQSVDTASVPENLLKNAGLAYVHLIRSGSYKGHALPPPQKDVLQTLSTGLLKWPVEERCAHSTV
jgi:hypothetical protein